KGRVTDERDDANGAIQFRRPSWRRIHPRRRRRSSLEQHSRNRREWLPGGARGIHELFPVKVIALLHASTRRSLSHRVIDHESIPRTRRRQAVWGEGRELDAIPWSVGLSGSCRELETLTRAR